MDATGGICLTTLTEEHLKQVKQLVCVALPAGSQYSQQLYRKLLTTDPGFRVVGTILLHINRTAAL